MAVKQAPANTKMKRSPEIEEEKCEIVPSLQPSDFTTAQGSSMYASNVSYNPARGGEWVVAAATLFSQGRREV